MLTMAKTRNEIPSYRRHRASGQAVFTLNGVDHYLGKWKSPESRAEYDRLTAEWLVGGRRLPDRKGASDSPDGMLLKELILGYFSHLAPALPDIEVDKLSRGLKPARQLFGETKASEFGPLRYKAVRASMVDAGLCISTINHRMGVIRRMIAWGVESELLPGDALHRLEAVAPLKAGRDAKAPREVKPIPDTDIDAVLPHLMPAVAAMVQLQRLTGMRPGEVCRLTTAQIDRTVDPWVYRPTKHKTKHRGKDRAIPLGPRAKELLTPWLRADPDKPLFSPRDSRQHQDANRPHKEASTEARRASARHYFRKRHKPTPVSRYAGESYSTLSYGNAVSNACRKASIPPFRPNRIRHTAATEIRHRFGIEAARVTLGHSSLNMTEVYAEADLSLASKVASEIG
jgi:integrase